jgi:hypothetical protein
MNDKTQLSQEEQQNWIRQQYHAATKYLAEKGMVTDSVVTEESRYLVPFLAMWKLKLLDGHYVWAISGDLPSDHSAIDVAPTAREAVRHFSLKWQLQAENLLQAPDETQHEFARILIGRSEGLYELYQNEKLWA